MRLLITILGAICIVTAFATFSLATEPTLETKLLVSADGLVGGTWQWTEIQTPVRKTVVPTPSNYTLEFISERTVNVKADCNSGSGSYTATGSSLRFGNMAMTQAFCGGPTLDSRFKQSLGAVRRYKIEGNTLRMDLVADGGTMTFSKARSNPLVGTKWNWVGTRTPNGDVASPDPTKYTLDFMPAGVLHIQADCNKITGSYSVEGYNITIKGGPSTMMACPTGSMDSTFMQGVGSMSTFQIIATIMTSQLKDNGGVMGFVKAGMGSSNSLVGRKWSWTNTQTPVEDIKVPRPTNYNLEFKSDGTVLVKADCNTGSGTYQTDGSSISFGPVAMTRMACGASLDTKFLQSLANVRTYKVDGDRLAMAMAADSGTMMFVRPWPKRPITQQASRFSGGSS